MKVKDIIFILNQLNPEYELEFLDTLEGQEYRPEWSEIWLAKDEDDLKEIYLVVDFDDYYKHAPDDVTKVNLQLPEGGLDD